MPGTVEHCPVTNRFPATWFYAPVTTSYHEYELVTEGSVSVGAMYGELSVTLESLDRGTVVTDRLE